MSNEWEDALWYIPGEALEQAVSLAEKLRRPLLVTGDPGCGKTTAAYWASLWRGKETLAKALEQHLAEEAREALRALPQASVTGDERRKKERLVDKGVRDALRALPIEERSRLIAKHAPTLIHAQIRSDSTAQRLK
jgi:broad-specificity NMP kinase